MTRKLAARYRRLLWFYPRDHRRAELLDTLLELAPPGRRRPTVGEAVNLCRFGLRARLGRPASRVIVVVSLLVAVATGFLGAAVGGRLGWETAGPLPTRAGCEVLLRAVFGDQHLDSHDRQEDMFVDSNLASGWAYPDGGEFYRRGYVEYSTREAPATHDAGLFLDGARTRLAELGWRQVGVTRFDLVNGMFWASRDGLILQLDVWPRQGSANLIVRRTPPAAVPYAAGAGVLIGTVLGWFLAAWASRRTGELRQPLRSLVSVCTGFALLGMLPATLAGLLHLTSSNGTPVEDPFWFDLIAGARLPALLAVPPTLLVLCAAALPRRLARDRDPAVS